MEWYKDKPFNAHKLIFWLKNCKPIVHISSGADLDFCKGGLKWSQVSMCSWVHLKCTWNAKYKPPMGSGGIPPRKFLKIAYSEIESGAFWGAKLLC